MKRSLLERSYTAATRWMASARGLTGFTENEKEHIAYRCGWSAGYSKALRDMKQRASELGNAK